MTLQEMRDIANNTKGQEAAITMQKLLRQEELPEEDDSNYVLVIAFAKMLQENCGGCFTPAEEFVWNLVLGHMGRPLTPSDVEHALEQFKEDFESVIAAARKAAAEYPKEMASAA